MTALEEHKPDSVNEALLKAAISLLGEGAELKVRRIPEGAGADGQLKKEHHRIVVVSSGVPDVTTDKLAGKLTAFTTRYFGDVFAISGGTDADGNKFVGIGTPNGALQPGQAQLLLERAELSAQASGLVHGAMKAAALEKVVDRGSLITEIAKATFSGIKFDIKDYKEGQSYKGVSPSDDTIFSDTILRTPKQNNKMNDDAKRMQRVLGPDVILTAGIYSMKPFMTIRGKDGQLSLDQLKDLLIEAKMNPARGNDVELK